MYSKKVKVNCQFGLSLCGKLLTVQEGIDVVRPFEQRERSSYCEPLGGTTWTSLRGLVHLFVCLPSKGGRNGEGDQEAGFCVTILASWGVTEGTCFPRMGPGRCGRIPYSWAAVLDRSAKFPHSPFVLLDPADAEPSRPSLNVSRPLEKTLASPTPPYQVASWETVFSTQS